MNYLYQQLLDPDLYDSVYVARFIETLAEPEIHSISDENAASLIEHMMPTDDINTVCRDILDEAKASILASGSLNPAFLAFPHSDNRMILNVPIPDTRNKADNLLVAGKSLGFVCTAQCIFFVTMRAIENDKIISGNLINESTDRGIFIIGSSLSGHRFVNLSKIIKNEGSLIFQTVADIISRDGECPHMYSRFFNIEDTCEMENIIQQIPKIVKRSSLTNKESLIQFATTLKALRYFQKNLA